MKNIASYREHELRQLQYQCQEAASSNVEGLIFVPRTQIVAPSTVAYL